MTKDKPFKINPEDMKTVSIDEFDPNYNNTSIDEFGNTHNFDEEVEQAEKEIEEAEIALQESNVNFRWYKKEIARCKNIAAKRGLKYQQYIKMVVSEALTRDEKLYGS